MFTLQRRRSISFAMPWKPSSLAPEAGAKPSDRSAEASPLARQSDSGKD
jgi:hypothetical protein